MDNTRLIQFVLLILAIICFTVAFASEPSKNSTLTELQTHAEDLTLIGDAGIICWYGNHEELGGGLFCFIQPHDNMMFLDIPREEPPPKKLPPDSSPSSSTNPQAKFHRIHYTSF